MFIDMETNNIKLFSETYENSIHDWATNSYRAFKTALTAAEQGDVNAMLETGYRYQTGSGIVEDIPNAIYWFKKAADLGASEALFMLGRACELFSEQPKLCSEMAKKYYQQAFQGGCAKALKIVVGMHIENFANEGNGGSNYYAFRTLKNMGIVKEVYDPNDNGGKLKWYVTGSEQPYTTYEGVRKGLREFLQKQHIGQYFEFDVKIALQKLDEIIMKQKTVLILTNPSRPQLADELKNYFMTRAKNCHINVSVSGMFYPFEHEEEERQKIIEQEKQKIYNEMVLIDERKLNYMEFESITKYKILNNTIKSNNIKNVFVDVLPDNIDKTEILAWGKELGITIIFTDFTPDVLSHPIPEEVHCIIHVN